MIEKMTFISISGPLNDFDRLVNQVLTHYSIQLENALTELKSAYKLVPLPGTNPYREPYQKAKKILELAASEGNNKQPFPELPDGKISSLDPHDAAAFIEETAALLDRFCAEEAEKQQALHEKQNLLELARLYEELDFSIPELLKFTQIKYRFGRVPKTLYPRVEQFANESDSTILLKCSDSDPYVSLIYFTPESCSDRIDAVYSSLQFERIFIPDQYAGTPKEEIPRLERETAVLSASVQEAHQKSRNCLRERQASLLEAAAVLKACSENQNIRRLAACTHDMQHPFYILCGWLSVDEAERLKAELKDDPDTFFSCGNETSHATSTPPTKLRNFALFRPFEMFVRMYGLPAYNEFDPTVLIAITYSVFFGFMFGDLGQGFLLFAGGQLLYRIRHVSLAAVISCCGIFSMIFGCLFGSVFGFEDVIPALWLRPTEAMTNLPFVGSLNTVFVVAIALGMAVILAMMLLNMIISFRLHDPEKTWFDTNGLAGFVFYLSLAAVIVLFMSGHALPAAGLLAVMFLIPLLVIFFKEPLTAILLKKKEKIEGGIGMFVVQGFFELFEVLLSYFSNTLSFVRIGAFAVSHAAMMEVVLMLAGAESGTVNIPVIVLGNLFVCGMEGLIVGIQVLRLEYYELFSRFYKGTGREFKPTIQDGM